MIFLALMVLIRWQFLIMRECLLNRKRLGLVLVGALIPVRLVELFAELPMTCITVVLFHFLTSVLIVGLGCLALAMREQTSKLSNVFIVMDGLPIRLQRVMQ